MNQGSEDWKQFKLNKIGSSEAAIIMGTSKYKNIYDLYLEKIGERKPKDIESFVTEKGEEYEDYALLDIEKETKLAWHREVFKSEENQAWIASLDGYNPEMKMIWECKFVGKDRFSSFCNPYMTLKERIGEDYYAQVIHQHLVTRGSKLQEFTEGRGYFTMVVDHKVFPDHIPKGEQRFKHIKYFISKRDYDYMKDWYLPKLDRFTRDVESRCLLEHAKSMASEEIMEVKDVGLEILIEKYKINNSNYNQIKKIYRHYKRNKFLIKPLA